MPSGRVPSWADTSPIFTSLFKWEWAALGDSCISSATRLADSGLATSRSRWIISCRTGLSMTRNCFFSVRSIV